MISQQTPYRMELEPPQFAAGKHTELREIVLFLDGRTEHTGILKFAVALAEQHDAHLIGVFIQPEPGLTRPEMFARGKGIQEVTETHRVQLKSIERQQRSSFEELARRYAIRSEWRSLSHWDSEVDGHTHYADLAVISRSEQGREAAGPSRLVEFLVLSSGRPTVMFPPKGTVSRVRRVVVGWNASREAARAVADAMPLLVRAEAVEVLVVDYQGYSGHGQEPGADIARHLARHGAKVEVTRLSSGGEDVGRILLSRAANFGADLLVMGAYGHSHFSERIFGGATRTVLHEAGLPVLMSR